jgi:cobalt-zinc-cadmium efflux system outer membrane protein
MFPHVRARLICAALLIAFAPASAGPRTLDLNTAVARARERAPEAIAALAQIADARARRVGAGVLFTENPEVQIGAGRRFGEPRTLAIDAQISQPLELARRGARIAVADAGVALAQATSEAELRRLGYEVATVFFEARFADFAVELAQRDVDVATRADIRAIDAEARVARAEGSLATANGRPDLGVWFGYERDEGDAVVLGGLTFTLPLWNRAQGDKAAARARLRSAQLERAAVVGAASRQLVDAFDAYARAREAVDVFDRDVVPVLADSEKLLERSIETGQVAIDQYLVARQQILDGRREHLERQLALAKAAATARFIAGVSP